MGEAKDISANDGATTAPKKRNSRRRQGWRRLKVALLVAAATGVLIVAGAIWLGSKAATVNKELDEAAQLVMPLKDAFATDDSQAAAAIVERIRSHTSAAKDAAGDPLWSLASSIPALGPNFSAVAEVARSADDVANLGLAPLANVFGSLDWNNVLPTSSGTNLEPLRSAAPSVSSAARAVRMSAIRLSQIDETELLPQISQPLIRARDQLEDVTGTLDIAAHAAEVIPGMMGAEEPRNYLLIVQNNAEARASGGIPGALAILNLDKGKLTLGAQSSAAEVGIMSPTVPVDAEQHGIYTGRLGKFMQDVNLTPDFPTAASTAQSMWERKTGQRVDGVISIDPIALSYILDATGPIQLGSPRDTSLASTGLPTQLDGQNVVKTLLSDVYSRIDDPVLQDDYFAGVAQEIFSVLSDGKADAKGLIEGLTLAAQERRVLIWSALASEESVIANYPLSGSVAGPSLLPAQFGVYFNDGTGAKMDYYVKRTVQLVKECPRDGYEQTTVRITSTNTAPPDAATSLPTYVTGGGIFRVPPGSVQTNIVAYGPVQANIESAAVNGEKTDFAPYVHSKRPVGVLAVRLAPGESRTVEFTFGKIVQHAEPNVVVTPTVQAVKDVTLPTENSFCG
jgi:Protein of unknown function (DUF4012)